MSETPRTASVPNDRAIWQSDAAKTYKCPTCKRPVFTQYEGNEQPSAIECDADAHRVIWNNS